MAGEETFGAFGAFRCNCADRSMCTVAVVRCKGHGASRSVDTLAGKRTKAETRTVCVVSTSRSVDTAIRVSRMQ